MLGDEIFRSIHVIFKGDSFARWSQAMHSYLKCRKLCLYVSGDRLIPEQVDKEIDSAYAIRIEDWESANHQIITWFCNTSIPSIVDEFGNINTKLVYVHREQGRPFQFLMGLCDEFESSSSHILH